MHPVPTIELLGIDNVLFDVDDLDTSIAFYLRCGFRLEKKIDERGLAILAVGSKTPGLLLRKGAARGGGRLWVEVSDAEVVAEVLEAEGIEVVRLETATGHVSEVRDPSDNRVGFADYSRKPEVGRVR